MSNHSSATEGFTLVEILLVFALFVIILGLTAPLTLSFVLRNDLDTTTAQVTQTLRRAQNLAADVDQDTPWGIRLQNNQVILFSGASFDTRNSSLDETSDFSGTITVTGNNEVVFNKLLGQPASPAFITLSNSLNQTRTVSINAAGLVSD